MIQRKKKRLVLFLPYRADPEQGVRVAADLQPLELLQIATIPAREGYEIHIVDAMIHDDYMQRLLELCDGALLFASSCILGFQVAHGARVAKAIREKFPELPIIHGGWFPSVSPETYIKEGIADAVALGQGEITFWEFVQALDNGTSLEDVAGLVIERDGKPHYTAHRPVVGFDEFPDVPWHLLEFEEYVKLQNNPHEAKLRHKLPDPHDYPKGVPYRTFAYFSSFGCPEPCTFCCSPMVTGRRWKAIPGKLLFERLEECRERFNFNQVRFQDANFGVMEKRSNEYCEHLIEAGSPYWWNATYEIETIARYQEESVDKMAAAGCRLCILGAEAGTEEQQNRIKKKIDLDTHLELALSRLYDRKIQTGTTWIIGYPDETPKSMLATLNMAARMKHNFPGSASDVFPFRPIPGTEDFDEMVKLGYEPPKTLEEWGSCLEYKAGSDSTRLPHEVLELWRRYGATATFYDGLASEGSSLVRGMLKSISGWRLRHGRYEFPLEQKLFDIYVRLTGQSL
ncbi:MAG: radical SAM protein, partial [Planctomycetota bacterium]|nr:radical SAM protein [Planctomycetota bacterium]